MYHEDREKLSEEVLNLKRAIDSLTEELNAVDWYTQRINACKHEDLKKILIHNANEEKEHAAMLIAWIKEHDKNFEKELNDYVVNNKKI